MFEGLKEALQYVNGLKEESMQPIVTEIAGKTYCNKDLKRYGREDLADPIYVNTLSAMVDYITRKEGRAPGEDDLTYQEPEGSDIILRSSCGAPQGNSLCM